MRALAPAAESGHQSPMNLKTLIVDDEPLAIERMQILCARIPALQLVGTAQDGEAALRLIPALEPDLIFLDIAMPGMTGNDVANALEGQSKAPAVVFVTAFDQFAVAAFDAAAIDYLLKPVAPERLENGDILIRRRADAPPPPPVGDSLREMLRPAPEKDPRNDSPLLNPQRPGDQSPKGTAPEIEL